MHRQSVPRWLKDLLPHRCMNCGATKGLQYHHIVPVSCGGQDVPSNIAVMCSDCHSKIHFGVTGKLAHNELVRDGIKRAKARGTYHGGKKPADYEMVMRLIAENSTQFNRFSETTEPEVMKLAGVKTTTYHKCKRMLLDAMAQEVWPYDWQKPKQATDHPRYEWYIKKIRGDNDDSRGCGAVPPVYGDEELPRHDHQVEDPHLPAEGHPVGQGPRRRPGRRHEGLPEAGEGWEGRR